MFSLDACEVEIMEDWSYGAVIYPLGGDGQLEIHVVMLLVAKVYGIQHGLREVVDRTVSSLK